MQQNSFRTTICRACIFLACALAFILPVTALDLGSASGSGTSAIANGDVVKLRGIATGHPQQGLQVWVISKNYLKISTISVNTDNTFTFEMTAADTQNLASGQYFVVVQHPMMNGQFDVYYNAGTGKVINRQMGGGNGDTIFTMSGAGSLQGPDSAQALVNAISSQNIDDTFTTYTFFVSAPAVRIEPVGDKAVGDRFTIQGTTNLAAGDKLMIDISSSSFSPTKKTSDGGFSGASGEVTVVPGSGGMNRWSFDVDTSSFKPDEYIVRVSGITLDVTGSTTFLVYGKLPQTMATPVLTTPASTTATAMVTPTAALPTTTAAKKSPVPLWILIAACAMALLARRI